LQLPASTAITGSYRSFVVIVDVLVTERNPEHALPYGRRHKLLEKAHNWEAL